VDTPGPAEQFAREVGMALDGLAVLRLLEHEGSGDDLARRLQACGREAAVDWLEALLRDLERRGLVRVKPGGQGERERHYALTAEGRRALSTCQAFCPRCPDQQAEAQAASGERAALAAERQEVERLRSDLLSTVSHELRTPLTLIRTSVGLLLDTRPDADMRERLLHNIKQSADRMHALVTDLLDLVRLRSGKAELHLRYVDVAELAAGVAALMVALLDQKKQTLELDLPSPGPRVMGDHRRLEQVLLNLLSNANKFAPAGASVRIGVVDRGQSVVVSVADSGPGIPPESQARLFEQFYTARTSSPSHNIGAGLGLPIAKGIVEAHGGEIWVDSRVGAGSVFYFSLPKEGPTKGGLDEDTGG